MTNDDPTPPPERKPDIAIDIGTDALARALGRRMLREIDRYLQEHLSKDQVLLGLVFQVIKAHKRGPEAFREFVIRLQQASQPAKGREIQPEDGRRRW